MNKKKDELLKELDGLLKEYLSLTGIDNCLHRDKRSDISYRVNEIIARFKARDNYAKLLTKTKVHFSEMFGNINSVLTIGCCISENTKKEFEKYYRESFFYFLRNHSDLV